MKLNIDPDQFIERVTEAKDPIVSLIKGHLFIEAGLIELIKLACVNQDTFDPATLNFPNKVRLASALGLIEKDEIRPFLFLNDLRNSLAHHLDKDLNPNDGRRLYSMLRKTERFAFALQHHPVLKRNPDYINPNEFPDILHICLIHFVAILDVSITHFRTRNPAKSTLPFTPAFYSREKRP
ncbi:UNVERIFIED_CONTAM: hypothetical protein ABID98_002780 [Brevibacillus sp. OAP136]